jgi:hypothetical protein
MKINYKHCLTSYFLLIAQITIGQVITVSGKVVDKGGLLFQSQYYRKINKVNTQTDFDGKFTIKANAKQIIASYIGMSSVEMPAASSMIFKLSEAANELESIVVGYGTLSKKKLTGNIAVLLLKT